MKLISRIIPIAFCAFFAAGIDCQSATILVGEDGGDPDAGTGATNSNSDSNGVALFYVTNLSGVTIPGSNGSGSNTFNGANQDVTFSAAGTDLLFRDIGGTVYAEFAIAVNDPGNSDSFSLNDLTLSFSGGTVYQLPAADDVEFFEIDTAPGDPFALGSQVLFNNGSQVRAAILVPFSSFTSANFTQDDTLTIAANFSTGNANDKIGITDDAGATITGRVTNPLAVPEPSSALLVMLGCVLFWFKRSRNESV